MTRTLAYTPTFMTMPLSCLCATMPDQWAEFSPTSKPQFTEKPQASSVDWRVSVGHSRFVSRSHPRMPLWHRRRFVSTKSFVSMS